MKASHVAQSVPEVVSYALQKLHLCVDLEVVTVSDVTLVLNYARN